MCDCPEKDIKVPKRSYLLKFYSECSGVFFTDVEINFDEDVELPFIHFHHYGDISSHYFHEHILSENCKTCFMNESRKFWERKRLQQVNLLY